MTENDEDLFDDGDDDLDLTLYADSRELASEVVAQALIEIEKGLGENETFNLVLTGGSLGILISQGLLDVWNSRLDDFLGLNIWWSDERFVSEKSDERNAAPLHGKVINKNIIVHEVLASDVAASVGEAVNHYINELEDVILNLNILGLGPDGHVASLFPGQANLDDMRRVIAVTDSPKPPAVRVSFTMAAINNCEDVWIVAAGAGKAQAVTQIFEGDLSIPASYVRGNRQTRLIVDTEAFFAEST